MRQPSAGHFAILVGALLSLGAGMSYSAGDAQWSYGGATGPTKWGSLEKGFAECKLGQALAAQDHRQRAYDPGQLHARQLRHR